jgi:hypothetical protein
MQSAPLEGASVCIAYIGWTSGPLLKAPTGRDSTAQVAAQRRPGIRARAILAASRAPTGQRMRGCATQQHNSDVTNARRNDGMNVPILVLKLLLFPLVWLGLFALFLRCVRGRGIMVPPLAFCGCFVRRGRRLARRLRLRPQYLVEDGECLTFRPACCNTGGPKPPLVAPGATSLISSRPDLITSCRVI